ncbi:MAG: hypothetical protein HOH27_02000, partial [Acidimicrobiaceae bacterium]|nr:hypothetical protein [Acidimicrobiaceae bacterium]
MVISPLTRSLLGRLAVRRVDPITDPLERDLVEVLGRGRVEAGIGAQSLYSHDGSVT